MKSLDEWTFLKSADDAVALEKLRPPETFYGKWLRAKGYLFPAHEKPGPDYINIYGRPDRIKDDRKFALIVYEPAEAEHHYDEFEDALHALRKIQPRDWQILNLESGEVLAEPKDWRKGRVR